MKITRILCVLMVMLLLSCTAFAESVGTLPLTEEEGATVSMLAMNSWYSTVDLRDAELLNELQKRANVTIEWNLIDPTIYSDTVSPMLASGQDLPDIIELPDTDSNMTYLSTGMFVALDEHFDLMPNYVKFLDENPVIKGSLTAPDGHIYYVPQTVVTDSYQPVLMYNMPWIEKLGIEPPKTLEAFVDMLRAFRDNDMNGNGDTTDEIPMSIQSGFLTYMFGPAFGLDLVSGFFADDEGVVHYGPAEPAYRDYLTFLHDLYEEGLLEVEFASLNRDQITERCANDLTGVTYDFSWQMSNLYSAQYPNYDGETGIIVGVPPLSGTHEGYYVGRTPVSGVFGINSKSDNIELAVKFLDYAMSEEAQDLYVWGLEGLTYEVDADGNRHFLPKTTEDAIWFQSLGINAPNMPSQQSKAGTDVLVPAWHVKAIEEQEMPYAHTPFPAVYSTTDEASIVSMYLVDLTTYVDERAVAFICGYSSIEDEFDSYLATLEAMQLDELLKVKQAQYDRYASAL